MERTGRTMGLWAAVGVVALMALVVPAFAAAAPASPAPSAGLSSDALSANASATQQWAYGGAKWVNVSLTIGSASYESHAFFGWQVIVTATNTSNTTVMLEEQRTMAASLYAQYCAPNCTAPRSAGNLSIRGSETDTGFANLTGTATVFENGSATSAVGLENAQARSGANLSESYRLTISNHTASGSLNANGAAHSQVVFSPALGLVPWNAAANTTWNSSAAFAASGAWAFAYDWARTGFFGASGNGSGTPSGSVSGNGTVDLNGIDLGPVTLANGRTVPVIVLAVSGPFDLVEGVILVPHVWAPFGTGVHPFATGALGTEAVATSRLDVAVDAVHHRFGVVASASSYSGTDDSLATGASTQLAAPGGSQPTAAETVQAQPETVPAAEQAATCLTSDCATPSHPGALGGSIVPVLVVGLVVIAAAGTVGVVEYRAWSRRKSGGQLVGGYSQQVPASTGTLPRPPQGPMPPSPPGGAL